MDKDLPDVPKFPDLSALVRSIEKAQQLCRYTEYDDVSELQSLLNRIADELYGLSGELWEAEGIEREYQYWAEEVQEALEKRSVFNRLEG